jgi:hypothetical protein
MVEIYNVLYKGVEIKVNPFCLAFLTEEEARSWIESTCDVKSYSIKSCLGWNDEKTMDDYRVEDKDGNSYYFVIFKQKLI